MSAQKSGREQQLFGSFASAAVRRGKEFYFDRALAMQFLDRCDIDDFAVIGIEGFRITPTATEPDMTLIADYSGRLITGEWGQIKRACNTDARQFVRAAPEGAFFNFVVSSSDERDSDCAS